MARILVVDDRPVNRQLFTAILKPNGHDVFEAEDGEDALDVLARNDVDLVVTDAVMPKMDGFELARRLRARGGFPLPIIFYTAAYEMEEVQALAAATGVARVVTKPSPPEKILRAVELSLVEGAEAKSLTPRTFQKLDRQHLRLLSDKLVTKVSDLEKEMKKREAAEAELRRANETLEARVAERTRELQEANEALQREVDERRKAEDEVRKLSALLPICAWCKKVRDDTGYWHQVETYIGRTTDFRFSHGVCPDCEKKAETGAAGGGG